jgi:hypothetical protein
MTYGLISLERARWNLARFWFIASGIIFILLVVQSIGTVYGDNLQTVWGWALPNFVPTLALMVSVFAADALRPYSATQEPSMVRQNFYQLALGLSIFYLIVLLATILSEPLFLYMRQGTNASAVDLLQKSNLWLGPLQGLVVGALGVLFFLKDEDRKAPGGAPNLSNEGVESATNGGAGETNVSKPGG